MRTLRIGIIFVVCLLSCLLVSKAQTNGTDSSEFSFRYAQSVKAQLAAYGMKILDIPINDTCGRWSATPVKQDSKDWLPFYMYSDSLLCYDYFPENTSKKQAGDINIIWIHGLNGNTNSWMMAAQATQFGNGSDFPARKARCYRGTPSSAGNPVQLYSEDYGIIPAARDLENYFHIVMKKDELTDKDYIIAHSQGGIVAREWLRQMDKMPGAFDRYAYGLVTFGTPHAGARVINNCHPLLQNELEYYLNDACQALAPALIIPKINSNFFTRMLVSKEMKDKLIKKSCTALSNTIIPYGFDNYFKRTTLDYYEEAPFLKGTGASGTWVEGLNQYTLKVPVVQFFGVEEQPVLWRFMGSTLKMGEDRLNNTELCFGYSNDDEMPHKVEGTIRDLEGREVLEEQISDRELRLEIESYALAAIALVKLDFYGAGLNLIKGFYHTGKKNAAIENQHAYGNAKNWFYHANVSYQNVLIGARTIPVGYICEITDVLECRDPHKNPLGSGVPSSKLSVKRKFYTAGASCYFEPINTLYANYHFACPDGSACAGPCTGERFTIATWKNQYSYTENDAVVLASSAASNIKVDTAYSHRIVLMPKTNHEQMKNSDATKKALTKLYNGEFGRFFQVGIR